MKKKKLFFVLHTVRPLAVNPFNNAVNLRFNIIRCSIKKEFLIHRMRKISAVVASHFSHKSTSIDALFSGEKFHIVSPQTAETAC